MDSIPRSRATARDRSASTALDRASITAAAVALLDEGGLRGLSTRRLADRLGVRSPTLYWHVRNKDELLDLVAESICDGAFDIDESASWRDQLMTGLRQFRGLLLRHPDAATLLRQRPPSGPVRLEHIERTVQILVRAGLSPATAAAVARVLAAHVLDSVSDTANDPREVDALDGASDAHLSEIAAASASLNQADVFELGCELIIDGVEARVRRRAGGQVQDGADDAQRRATRSQEEAPP